MRFPFFCRSFNYTHTHPRMCSIKRVNIGFRLRSSDSTDMFAQRTTPSKRHWSVHIWAFCARVMPNNENAKRSLSSFDITLHAVRAIGRVGPNRCAESAYITCDRLSGNLICETVRMVSSNICSCNLGELHNRTRHTRHFLLVWFNVAALLSECNQRGFVRV